MNGPFRANVVSSVLLHVVVAGAATWLHIPEPDPISPAVYTVSLVQPEPSRVVPEPRTRKPEPKPEPKPKPKPKPKPEPKPEPKTEPPTPQARPLPRTQEPTPEPEPEPRTEPSAPSQPAAKPEPESARSEPASSPVEPTATGPIRVEGDAPDAYLSHIVSRIGRHWSPDQGPGAGGRRAVVFFRILPSGQIDEIRVETPSGSRSFDRAARNAVRRASPFWRLPRHLAGEPLAVHFEFTVGDPDS